MTKLEILEADAVAVVCIARLRPFKPHMLEAVGDV